MAGSAPTKSSPFGARDAFKPPPQTVMVVDDEADIRESLKELLEISLPGYIILAFDGGPAALEAMKKQRPDLIITDYKMPGMNGLEFLAAAKKAAPKAPCILITAFPDLELAIRAINEARIENFITKPLEPTKVVDVVKTVLDEERAKTRRDQAFARSLDALKRRSDSPPHQ